MSALAKIICIFLTIQWTLVLFSEAHKGQQFYFPSSDNSLIEVLENATISKEGIDVTSSFYGENLNWSRGWAFYKEPIEIWHKSSAGTLASFQSYFRFKICPAKQTKENFYADGLTFFMAPWDAEPPLNGSGMWLGLFNSTTNGKSSTQTIAIEFDTFQNNIIDEYYGVNAHDPDDNHVGIDINNITSVKTVSLSERLNSGQIWEVWIDYCGQTKELKVFMANNRPDFTSPRPTIATLTYPLNLSDFLPAEVKVGFSASTGLSNQRHNIIAWNFSSETSWGHNKVEHLSLKTALPVAVVAVMLILGAVMYRVKSKKGVKSVTDVPISDPNCLKNEEVTERLDDEISLKGSPRVYSYEELSRATATFSKDLLLGRGGFGSVYRGNLEDGETVAVKQISNNPEGLKQYKSEIAVLDSLSHPNLVPLLGWCHENSGKLLLVYQYMSNGSLDRFLFAGQARIRNLSWSERFRIVSGLASALHHLHVESSPRVLHRDIKPSNIMLDCNFVARLGDYGLARLMEHDNTSYYTDLCGTLGYIAPECFQTHRASSESDVFSFGVVALEIACGRRALDRELVASNMGLVGWVHNLNEAGHILDAADPMLDKENDGKQIERLMLVGLWCSVHDYRKRPRIQRVLQALNFEVQVPKLPRKLSGETYWAHKKRFKFISSASCI